MRLSILAVTLPLLLPIAAAAQDRAVEDAVKGRQGYFTMLGINMGTLAGMANGSIAYDEATARTAGANIEALTGYDLPSLFVEGSSNGDVSTTKAQPNIWSDNAGFTEDFAALREAAAGLPDRLAGGQGSVGPALGALGATCKACHDDYRAN